MKCPHCLTSCHDNKNIINIGDDISSRWTIIRFICPECSKFSLYLREEYDYELTNGTRSYIESRTNLFYPKSPSRTTLPDNIPSKYSNDYKEACLVLSDSSKASAALSRRCLQHILRDELETHQASLAKEIQEILDRGRLPTHILESLDSVRNIGNFATHPIKSNSTGEVVDVEVGEAEWNLDVIEALFDYLFLQPAIMEKKREQLNKKLTDAGKPPLKQP